ncbi:pyridoxal phosphate-dependent decarboxylase family protein [Agromyces atrinae]|uniref:Glutamate/tyrosine decarboxylase-like PLP-dependent enzyme n=1 Tax=Agromyces atrinae TaxID=592376 RepID=A0A852RWJ5_9MICO|nr:aminotransferase class V-fold PLP-dependent enzyme [Agromyces atrinae]NYD65578.1 glutamate/tyrosine decarboxylase-like PLP-dependent enzyme [Agromyces atrinae]
MFDTSPETVLERLAALREGDAPTHGGHVLSYVYDSGLAQIDELAASAARIVQPLNALDPTTFPSVAVLEGEVVGFARRALHGGEDVVGSVTSGGTESCLLAVATARAAWRARGGTGRARIVAPSTVHAAFHKAAHYLDLDLDLVPVDAEGRAIGLVDRLGPDVALVVVSAPSYPFATLDDVETVAAAALAAGVDVHVDACIGGFALAFWPGEQPLWDFRVPGVTSLSADLHKYGYAPKGVSVLLQRGRDRQRLQYFATSRWPGYPVVNATLLGSKPAGPLAAAWAIIAALGVPGFERLTAQTQRATAALQSTVEHIDGLRLVGDPVGPLFAVCADEGVPAESRVDPHLWADEVRARGFLLQLQPGLVQSDGPRLPHTTHLTITPVTEAVLSDIQAALVAAADAVRGVPAVSGADVLASVGELGAASVETGPSAESDLAAATLTQVGLLGDAAAVPDRLAPVLALVEELPAPVVERLLVELIARVVEPR